MGNEIFLMCFNHTDHCWRQIRVEYWCIFLGVKWNQSMLNRENVSGYIFFLNPNALFFIFSNFSNLKLPCSLRMISNCGYLSQKKTFSNHIGWNRCRNGLKLADQVQCFLSVLTLQLVRKLNQSQERRLFSIILFLIAYSLIIPSRFSNTVFAL